MIERILVVALTAVVVVQLVVIEGIPFLSSGLRGRLEQCEAAKIEANNAAIEALAKGREEGRIAQLAAGAELREGEAKRAQDLEQRVAELAAIAARLSRPPKPIEVTAVSEPPVVVTPPVASCALDRTALDDLSNFLNVGRAP